MSVFAVLAGLATMFLPGAGRADALARPSQTMYTPPSGAPSPGTLYPRAMRLQHNGSANGTILATFEQYTNTTPVFPIYRSTDDGNSWTKISEVADTQNGWGMRWEPELFELPTAVGDFPAGTIMAAGDSVPGDRSATKIDLYASTDRGLTWTFVTNIATGGRAISSNGYTPVWEPFFLYASGKLIVYYSDQRDTAHGQKIVHQVSTDGRTWGPVVDDVVRPNYADRPGMPVVTRLPNGTYVMTHEYCGAPEGGCSVYYHISSDPENFISDPGQVLRANDGLIPSGAPYVTWLPAGGPNGTLVVSSDNQNDLFVNSDNGSAGGWTHIRSNLASGYSRGLLPLADGHSLLVLSGGRGRSTGLNTVTFDAIDLGSGISDGATYTVSNANSGLKLTIAGGATANGTYATQQNTDNATDQQWRFTQQSSGFFKVLNAATGKVLGVEGGSTADGAKVLQWDDNGTLDHEWAVAPSPAGGYTLTSRVTGKYLEIPNASTAAGTTADQGSGTGCACQRWNFTQTALPPLGTGQYILVNKNSGKYLDIPGASTATNTAVQQYSNSACFCQLYTFQSAGSGAWTIKNVNSNLNLDIRNGSTGAGAAVVQNTPSTATSQQWTLTDAGNGYYELKNVNSGLNAGVAQSSTSNGASVIQWTDLTVDDQLWKIARIN
ncbi:RICIN domain-containing protein [Streptomyces sp. NBC_01537]